MNPRHSRWLAVSLLVLFVAVADGLALLLGWLLILATCPIWLAFLFATGPLLYACTCAADLHHIWLDHPSRKDGGPRN